MISPSEIREKRFQTLIAKSCSSDVFDLCDFGIGEKTAAVLADVVTTKSFKSIRLGGNSLRDTGTKFIGQILSKNSTLTEIDLRSNDIGVDGAPLLFESLYYNPSVTSLDLSGLSGINRNHIGKQGVEKLSELLSRNSVLSKLSLRENGLGPEAGDLFGTAQRNTTLTYLDIGFNSLGPDGSTQLASSLRLSGVIHLLLPRNNIGDAGASVFANLLRNNPPITTLDLSANKISHGGGKFIGDILRQNTILESLVLEKNDIGTIGVRAIAESLRENCTLKNLYVGDNGLDGKDKERVIYEMGETLKYNTALTKLDLSNNALGDEAIGLLVKALSYNSYLIHLDISVNKVGDNGGGDIAHMLTLNKNLQYLNLKNNSMNEVTGELLASSMKVNHSLLGMEIGFNDFNYKHVTIIQKKTKSNMKAYKEAEIERMKKEIEILSVSKEKLDVTEAKLKKESEMRAQVEETLTKTMSVLKDVDDNQKTLIRELKDAVLETTKQISITEHKHNETATEIMKMKQEREAKVFGIAQRVHKEKDASKKLEKKLKTLETENIDNKAAVDRQLEGTSTELNNALMEKKEMLEKVDKLQQQIDQLKQKIYPTTSAPEEPLRSAKSPSSSTRFPPLKSR